MTETEIMQLLRDEMQPATGCTGPTAYALATASCKPYLTSEPTSMMIYVSPAFLKIGFGVASPGTNQPGIEIAAALGFVGGNWKLGLQVLEHITSDEVAKAHDLANSGIISVQCDWEQSGVYVRAEIHSTNEVVIAVVEHTHDGVSSITVNGQEKYSAKSVDFSDQELSGNLALTDVFSFVEHANPQDLQFLFDGYQMNLKLAEDGLKNEIGLMTGRAYLMQYYKNVVAPKALFDEPLSYLPESISERAKILVAAASDARMGGSRLPAMAAMGDGNQGITALLPVGATAELLKASEEKTIRALALSCLLLFYVKLHIGRTSAFCLCGIAASAGVAGGIAYLQGMSSDQVWTAVKNVISPLAGMLCDGAKNGCAVKMAIATSTALMAVDLAAAEVELGYYDGLTGTDLPATVAHISRVATRSAKELDQYMVEEILSKDKNSRQ